MLEEAVVTLHCREWREVVFGVTDIEQGGESWTTASLMLLACCMEHRQPPLSKMRL